MQLFRVYTKEYLVAARTGVESMRGVQGVGWMEWDWVRVGREKPVAPYPWLIRDYHRLPEQPVERTVLFSNGTERRIRCGGRAWAEQAVDECFTAAEIAVLTRYLSRHHRLKVRTRKVRLPINGVPYARGLRRPLIGDEIDRVLLDCLAEGSGYDLPFAVYRRYRQASLLDTWRDTVILLPDMAPVPVAFGTGQPKSRGVGSAKWARSHDLQSTNDQEQR